MTSHAALAVTDRSQVSEVRQAARVAAERAGFGETDAHRAGLVATELATNLVKHSGVGGQLLLRACSGPAPEIELIAVDRGPGIANVAQSLADGFSTAGSAGTGLGAIRRIADVFDIYSLPGNGTVVLARVRSEATEVARPPAFEVGGISVAMPGETICGDGWTAVSDRGRAIIGVVDGLGHGKYAAEASAAALRAMAAPMLGSSVETLSAMHDAVRHTRGAAGTVVSVDPRATMVTAAGVGNVSAVIVADEKMRQTVSLGGILGHQVRQFRQYQYPWSGGAMLVMHSDGLISHWSLEPYPGLRQRHPVVVAAVLYRDFQRGRDDVTVVVGREAA